MRREQRRGRRAELREKTVAKESEREREGHGFQCSPLRDILSEHVWKKCPERVEMLGNVQDYKARKEAKGRQEEMFKLKEDSGKPRSDAGRRRKPQ